MMQTLVVPILGLIQNDLETSSANVSWVTTATLLSAAVFTPLLGRFGDQHGKKKTLVAVLVVMVAGSVLAAVTHSLLWLIVGRVLQGAATAIFPLALSVLREEIRPAKLPGAMAMVSGTLAFGSGLALVATGLLTSGDNPDYRSAFWLATGLAALSPGGRRRPSSPPPARPPAAAPTSWARSPWPPPSSCSCCPSPRGTSGAGARAAPSAASPVPS
ncbi:hypothetical protein GCM10020221_00930 [Streptomyces thioluteus]|uniref:Major facilitator superfamily (MFS) profile domain-containing protein n=2 Tax=Streptomyces thioluteus TaxID=66431 RepID=A0ABN3WCJ7_STRTU